MKEDYSKYVGRHVFIVCSHDGETVCRYVGKVSKLDRWGNPILEGIIKFSSNKLCFKENGSIYPWKIKTISSAEYMAVLAAYKKHEQMRVKINKIFNEYHKNL